MDYTKKRLFTEFNNSQYAEYYIWFDAIVFGELKAEIKLVDRRDWKPKMMQVIKANGGDTEWSWTSVSVRQYDSKRDW